MIPRLNSLVTTNPITKKTLSIDFPVFIYLGEIPNMIGHCSLINIHNGEVVIGYHIDSVRELTDEEV